MTVADRVFTWRCRRAARLLEVQRRRALETDLAAYATPRERADLVALLDHLDDDQTAEVRDILGRQELREELRQRPVAGFAVSRAGW